MTSAAWEKRNAAARAKGYTSYYDYRAHDFGRRAPGTPRASGEQLRRLRGHSGPADLARAIQGGRVELINAVQVSDDPPTFSVLVVMSDGSQRRFTLKGAAAIDRFQKDIGQIGDAAPGGIRVVGSPKAVAALSRNAELEAEQLAAEADEAAADPDSAAVDFTDDDIPF